MIWTPVTLSQVRSLRSAMVVSADQILGHAEEIALYAKRRVADELVRAAEPLGAVIDLRDIDFITREKKLPPTDQLGIEVQARWFPAHGIVELLGGPRDGGVLEVAPQLIGQPIYFDILADARFPGYEPDGKLEPLPTTRIEYRPSGWREETRSWIYRYYL